MFRRNLMGTQPLLIQLGFSWEFINGDKDVSDHVLSVALVLLEWCGMPPPAGDMLVCKACLAPPLSM